MIGAMSLGYQVFNDDKYLLAAQKSAQFIKDNLYKKKNLSRRFRKGESKGDGVLDDYAYLIEGLIHLYQTDFNEEWLKWAIDLQATQNQNFSHKQGGYFYAKKNKSLISRSVEFYDSARPNANAISAQNLLSLYGFTYKKAYLKKAKKLLSLYAAKIKKFPPGFSRGISALDFYLSGPKEIALIGDKNHPISKKFLKFLRSDFNPYLVVAHKSKETKEGPLTLVLEKPAIKGIPTAYVCTYKICKLPTSKLDLFKNQVNEVKDLRLIDQ